MPRAPYHPRYCEENAWHLCGLCELEGAEASVVVVSNRHRAVAMWAQRAAGPGVPVAWDYHVFVVARTGGWQVWDPDTLLGYPVGLERYLADSFATAGVQPARFDPRFRVVAASEYRSALSSDRSHMRGADGRWLAPPPPWPPIGADRAPPNLLRFVDLDDPYIGRLGDLTGLRALFAGGPG